MEKQQCCTLLLIERGITVGETEPPAVGEPTPAPATAMRRRRSMESVGDLVEEAKVRTVWWALCVLLLAVFLSQTSKSTLINIPVAFLIFAALRLLSYEVEFRWKVRPVQKPSYLSHLQKKQLRVDDPRLSTLPAAPSWKKKIGSPLVEAAIDDFISKILKDFVIDLWYSAITPDREFPEQIRVVIHSALGEVSRRLKEINLVDLLTRDLTELVGNHIDLYRKNQASIGVDVMATLSFDERDEKLRQYLLAHKELHPALISTDSEYKILQRLMSGVLSIALKAHEGPLVRSIARELLTSLVMQPVMNFACPSYVNELVEYVFLSMKDDADKEDSYGSSIGSSTRDASVRTEPFQSNSINKVALPLFQEKDACIAGNRTQNSEILVQSKPADWARKLDAVTQRRTQVLAPENLENLWSKGRNYQKKGGHQTLGASSTNMQASERTISKHLSGPSISEDVMRGHSSLQKILVNDARDTNGMPLKRSSSSPALDNQSSDDTAAKTKIDGFVGPRNSQTSVPEIFRDDVKARSTIDFVTSGDGSHFIPKLKCRVLGAYFEKAGSKSFAVYSVSVTGTDNKTWFVKRRYRNFERLHRHLKEIPNYSLHLPPKRFLSSSIDDQFVHQRCLLLDKYLQDLLSIANVAEQHEVWDFLSAASKNYSFGKSTSVMKTLAVNVDDAVDDIVRQVKGVSDGLLRKVSVPSSIPYVVSPVAEANFALPSNVDEGSKFSSGDTNVATSMSLSDDDHDSKGELQNERANGWHSDNELNSKSFPPRIVKRFGESGVLSAGRIYTSEEFGGLGFDRLALDESVGLRGAFEDSVAVPPEWSPSNVSVPLLNLVDKIFQLKRRGWLRRQVYWISKQILQLVMEDAIDDWLLNQIQLLRRDDVVAAGIRWVSDILWPNGVFFLKLELNTDTSSSPKLTSNAARQSGNRASRSVSFESQLEAARRASDIKKMLLGGAPSTLVSLIGQKQYRRSAKDIYFFLQSTTCLKQLAYCLLELVLLSVFPELHDLIQEIHDKAYPQTI